MEITISVPVKKTESPDKVKKAVLNIFPDAELELGEDVLSGRAKDIAIFKELLVNQRIRTTARAVLLRAKNTEKTVKFMLNKQVAYVGKLNFVDSDECRPLGDIEVCIGSENIDVMIAEITETQDSIKEREERK